MTWTVNPGPFTFCEQLRFGRQPMLRFVSVP